MDCTLKLVTDHPDKAKREIRVVVEMTPREALDIYVSGRYNTSLSTERQFRFLADAIAPFEPRLSAAIPKPAPEPYPFGTVLCPRFGGTDRIEVINHNHKGYLTRLYLGAEHTYRSKDMLDAFWRVIA